MLDKYKLPSSSSSSSDDEPYVPVGKPQTPAFKNQAQMAKPQSMYPPGPNKNKSEPEVKVPVPAYSYPESESDSADYD